MPVKLEDLSDLELGGAMIHLAEDGNRLRIRHEELSAEIKRRMAMKNGPALELGKENPDE